MKQTNSYHFRKYVCNNEGIDYNYTCELYLPTTKANIKNFTKGEATNCKILVDGKLLPYIPDESCPSTRNKLFDKATKIIKTIPIPIDILIKKCNKVKIQKQKNTYPITYIVQYNNEIYFYLD